MDLDQTRYQTFDDLFGYCRRVASAVGMICIRIFRCQSPRATDYALYLGVALQLTNILRDVKGDLAQGRMYLPQEDMRAFGCTENELARGLVSDSVRQLIAFECRRAHDFYRRAVAARPPEDRRRLVAAEIMRAVYFETLQRIEQNGYDVFSKPTRVPKPVQAAIALREWLFRHEQKQLRRHRGRRGLRGLSAAVRLTARARVRWSKHGTGWAARDRVSRSGDRRAGGQRPAHSDGLLSRNAGVPRRYRRQRSCAFSRSSP